MIWLAVMLVVASSVNHTPAEAWELGNTLLIQLQHSQDCSDWFQMTPRCKGKLFIEIAVKIKLTNILHTKNNSRNSVWMINVCIVVIFQFYRQNIVQIGAWGSFKKCKNWQKKIKISKFLTILKMLARSYLLISPIIFLKGPRSLGSLFHVKSKSTLSE